MLTKEIHKQLVRFAEQHKKADEYVSGSYEFHDHGEGIGACAIGCAVHDCKRAGLLPADTNPGDHKKLAKALGVPEMVLHLEDHIFEGLPRAEQVKWPVRFCKAIEPGKDYSHVPALIIARLGERLADDAIREDVRAAAKTVATLWRRRGEGDEPKTSEWDAAWKQAYAAWKQAYAAREQADAAREQADAAREQADAARKQAYAAWDKFWSWCADVVIEEMQR